MKHFLKLFMTFAATMIALCIFNGCSEEQISQDDGRALYKQMICYSHYFDELQKQTIAETRSDAEFVKIVLSSVDISIIDSKPLGFFESFTQSENILDWDEMGVLNIIAKDLRLSQEDKTCLVKMIGGVYSIKQQFLQTRADQLDDDCVQALAEDLDTIAERYLLLLAATINVTEFMFGEEQDFFEKIAGKSVEYMIDAYLAAATRIAIRHYRECLKSKGIDCSLEDGYDGYEDYDVYFNEEDDGEDNGFPPEEDDNNDDAGLGDENNWPMEEEAFEEEAL